MISGLGKVPSIFLTSIFSGFRDNALTMRVNVPVRLAPCIEPALRLLLR